MEYWKGFIRKPYMECLLPTILAFCMLVISIICLVVSCVYYAKLFGQFPVFNNVIVRTGLVQSPITPVISNLNQSADMIRRTLVTSNLPSIFVNQSQIQNLTANFIPQQQIPIAYPFLTQATVAGLIGDSLTVQNATANLFTINATFSATNVSNLQAGDVKPATFNITNLNTQQANVQQATTAQALTITGQMTVQGKSVLESHNNTVSVTANNLTTLGSTTVGGQVGTSQLLDITSSLTIQGSVMEVQSGTVSLTQTSKIVAFDDNAVHCPLGLQANTITFTEQNVTLTQAFNVSSNAAITTANVTTLTSQQLQSDALTSQAELMVQNQVTATQLNAGPVNTAGTLTTDSISTSNNKVQLSAAAQSVTTPTVSFREGTNTLQVSPTISVVGTPAQVAFEASSGQLTLGSANTAFTVQTATFAGGASFTNGLNGTSLQAPAATVTNAVTINGDSTVAGTFSSNQMSANSVQANTFQSGVGGFWLNNAGQAFMSTGVGSNLIASICGTQAQQPNLSVCFNTSQSNDCKEDFNVP